MMNLFFKVLNLATCVGAIACFVAYMITKEQEFANLAIMAAVVSDWKDE